MCSYQVEKIMQNVIYIYIYDKKYVWYDILELDMFG